MIRSLPAHVAWRYSRVRLSIAGAVVIALLLAGMLAWQPDPPPADAVLTVTRAAPDGTIEAYDLAFHAESWDVSTPLADLAESPLQPYARDNGRDVLPSPERTRWIVERATNDSGGIDLFLPTHDGEVRLTHTPGDDKLPLWSPDGAMVVFHTARWNANSWYDLATMDMETQEIRRLTSTNAQDHLGSWSPDGSRIAFDRRWIEEPHPEQVCHIARDGTDERCYDPIGGTWLGVVGWYDPVTIITVLDSDGRQLAYFNLERRTLTRTPIIMHDRGAVSPDGRWLLCHCVEAGDDRLRWLIVPTDRPRDSRHLMSGDTVLYNVRWRRGSLPPRYVDSLTVRAPTTEVPLETSHRFVAEGFGPDGARVPMGPVRWTVDDSQIATIDADGTIHPLREGVVRVRASLGGWREASATVRIVAPTYQITLREAWTPDWETRWRSFGDPRPERNEGPDGIHGIMNGGDGSFHSGAYRHLAFDASQGLGVDAALSTPLTEVQWQTQYVGLHAAADTSWYPVWDHSTRGIPMTSDDASCQFLFPANTGLHASNQYRVSVIRIDQQTFTDSTLKTGAWYHVRIQLFPDGRCGVAVNGMARWISSGRAPTTVPYRLGVAGNSKGTKMLVGPLEVWTGVRPGIDWSVAQPNR